MNYNIVNSLLEWCQKKIALGDFFIIKTLIDRLYQDLFLNLY